MSIGFEDAKEDALKKYERLKKEGVGTDEYGNDNNWVIRTIKEARELELDKFRKENPSS